jgi:stage V sporulation protein D (sporulation-specific penicillin-binding protein)
LGGANRIHWMDNTLQALHEALDIPMADLRALFVRDADGIWHPIIHDNWRIVAREIPANAAIPLRDGHRDVYLEEISIRMYADPYFAPQVLGFVRYVPWGLEARYNTQLSGTAGRMFRAFDANNTLIRDELPVQHGHTLVTTLDADIQRMAQQVVDNTFQNMRTDAVAMIVMCPHTGEILAMAEAPNFSLTQPDNPALFTDASVYAAWDHMTPRERSDAWNHMWRNYHTTYSFEPGSVFKPVVIAAALEEGVIRPNDVFHCSGSIWIEGSEITCFDRAVHGSVNVSQVLALSCNVGTIQIMQRLGRYGFYRYRGYFGYGERTGIDLPGEEAVSSPAVMYPLHALGPVELATSSIGQGFNNTAIQAAVSYAALINGGNILRPFVVSHVIDINGAVVLENRPHIVRRAITRETSDWIRTELEQTILHGTGRQTRIQGHTIGGKTGTAQFGAAREFTSIGYWIYTPVENPEFLVYIVAENVEHGRTAGNTLAPILRGFMEDLIILRNMMPSEGPFADEWHSPVLGLEAMPDFTGMRVNDVVRNLIARGVAFQIHGGGTVVTHTWPGHAPGRTIPQPGSIPVQIHTDRATAIPGGMTVMPYVVGLNAVDAFNHVRDALFVPQWFGAEGALTDYEVYRQYPAAGTEAEQGMEIILRVRRIN